jgi:hypothetical protein
MSATTFAEEMLRLAVGADVGGVTTGGKHGDMAFLLQDAPSDEVGWDKNVFFIRTNA